MRFALLGDVDPARPAFGQELGGARPRAILELLLINAGQPLSVDFIIDELWPERPPKTARNSVQRFVSDIRRELGNDRDRLETTAEGYRLRIEASELDLYEVRRLQTEAERKHDQPLEAAALLRQALGHFAPSLPAEGATPHVRAARLEHEALRLTLLEARIEAELATNRASGTVEELRHLTAAHPYHEGFWSQMLRALEAGGRRVEALREFENLRRTLANDIGIEPSPALRDIQRRLLEPDEPVDVGPVARDSAPLATVPPDQTLVGRASALDRLEELLDAHRLITIVGPGGIGKTTLALTAARRRLPAPESPVVVRLAEIERADQLPDHVAEALAFQPAGTTPAEVAEEVVDVLAQSSPLLILDNAEHVIVAVAELADHLVDRSNCRIIVTSRERLGIRPEWVMPLQHLTVPSDAIEEISESEVLFRLRASALGVELAEDSPQLRTVCEALEGLPLAIELAASQLEHLGIADLGERLDSLLDMTARRSAELRHSSLNSLIQWSWDLLDPDEVRLVGQMAVFRGRLDAGTVEAVAGPDGLTVLGSVVAKCLVGRSVQGERAWFDLSDSVRRFALRKAEQTGDLDGLRDTHADYLLGHLRRWSISETNAWDDVIEEVTRHRLEYDSALDWLDESGRQHELIEMASRVTGMWGRRGPGAELEKWSQRVHEVAQGLTLSPDQAAAVLVLMVEAGFRSSDYGRMAKYGEELVESEAEQATDLGTPVLGFYATAIHTFSLDALSRSRVEAAAERAHRTTTAELNIAQTQMWLGSCQLMDRDFEPAIESFAEVLQRTRRPGGTVLWAELGLAAGLHLLDRNDEALDALRSATSRAEDSIWNYTVEIVRSIVEAATGDINHARERLSAAAQLRILERRAASRDDFQIGFGLVASRAGEAELARHLLIEPMAQSPVLTALLFNHVHPGEYTEEEWRTMWARESEFRLLSALDRFAGELAPVSTELARWWPERHG